MHAEPDGRGDALEVERQRDGGAVGVAGDDRQEARQAILRVAGELRAVDREDRRLGAARGGGAAALDVVGPLGARPARRRRAMPDGPGDVLRAGPPMALLRAALLLGEDVRPVAHVERADALGALELVGGERDACRRRAPSTSRSTYGGGLHGVDVEEDAAVGVDPAPRSPRSAGWCRPRCSRT